MEQVGDEGRWAGASGRPGWCHRSRLDLPPGAAARLRTGFEVPFLVAPVRQPILSLRKLASDLQAELVVRGRKSHLTISGVQIEVNRVRMSYYGPVCPLAPGEAQWVQKVASTKMMVVQGDLVKYRQHMKVDPKPLSGVGGGEPSRPKEKAKEPVSPALVEAGSAPGEEEPPRPSIPTGCSSSEESDTWTRARGAQTKTPSLEEEVLAEDEEPTKGSKRQRAEEPRGEGPARKRSELSAEERARDNWEARQKKRSRKAEWTWSDRHGGWTRQGDQAKPGKGSKGPGKKGKS